MLLDREALVGSDVPEDAHRLPEPRLEAAPRRTRILIADGDPLTRQVVCGLLRISRQLLVIAEAADGVEAAELALHYRPEVVISELRLRQLDGVAAMRRVRDTAPEVAFIFLTGPLSPEKELECLRAGASGVLSKALPPDALVRSVASVAAGEAAVSRELSDELVRRLRAMPRVGAGVRPIRSTLTAREWEVLDLLGAGYDPVLIAARLGLAVGSVRSHLKHARRKLGVSSRTELVGEADRLWRRDREPTAAVVG